MHSNFITPPDRIETILLVDATEEQIKEVANTIQGSETPYTIYLYNAGMANIDWLADIVGIIDTALIAEESQLAVTGYKFGPSQPMLNPAEYFTKLV